MFSTSFFLGEENSKNDFLFGQRLSTHKNKESRLVLRWPF
jgi:hypothetical protein